METLFRYLYRASEGARRAWARWRHAADFEDVERFCLFVGIPRSGHSTIGALLNAHRDAVISHELDAAKHMLAGDTRDQLYAAILARDQWVRLRGRWHYYPHWVPTQFQGRFSALRVIGDKRGGALTWTLEAHPDFLQRVRELTGVPLRLIHVIRNPFDNIAAISRWQDKTLDESIAFYFDFWRTTSRLPELCAPDELLSIRHEDMVRSPAEGLGRLCGHLDLDLYPGYVEDCCRGLYARTPGPIAAQSWTPALIREVERRSRALPALDGYEPPRT